METQIEAAFARIEEQRAALLRLVGALGEAELNWQPKAGAWSVRQIVEHLVLTDETLGQVVGDGKMQAEGFPFRLLPRASRRAMILRALDRDRTLPMPSMAVDPTSTTSLARLIHRWDSARSKMREALGTMSAGEARYFHPVAGPLTAAQMLDLDFTHAAYHIRQMDALRSSADFPRK